MPSESETTQRQRLTAKQRRLRDEIRQLAELVAVDPDHIIDDSDDTLERTTRLELARERLIRSEVVFQYTLITEFIDSLVAEYYFGPFNEKRGMMHFWRTKKFQNFNYYILEPLPLIKKLELLNDVLDIPKDVVSDIHAINDLRNALAHSFFPENLRRYRTKGVRHPTYKGQTMRSIETVERFLDDIDGIREWFFSRLDKKGFRKRRNKSGASGGGARKKGRTID